MTTLCAVRALVVITGAGASYDCVSSHVLRRTEYRPPLVVELFAGVPAAYAEILHEYPLAEAAAADIRPQLDAGAVAIEQFLRERLRDSSDPYARRRYLAVPLYLQHLLFQISKTDGSGYTRHPDHYDALVNAVLPLDEVIFITLNYDTLLDQRLFLYSNLHSMDAYIEPGRNWSLIKLHGSVNWGRVVRERTDASYSTSIPIVNSLFARLIKVELEDEIVLRDNDDLSCARYDSAAKTLFYPALSVPLGHDEVVCPPSHHDHLRARLGELYGLNLIVIGYSGLDREVLTILKESKNSLRSLLVVSDRQESALGTAEAITQQFHSIAPPEIVTGGFSELVSSGMLHRFIERIVD
jgi:hypothetical protein